MNSLRANSRLILCILCCMLFVYSISSISFLAAAEEAPPPDPEPTGQTIKDPFPEETSPAPQTPAEPVEPVESLPQSQLAVPAQSAVPAVTPQVQKGTSVTRPTAPLYSDTAEGGWNAAPGEIRLSALQVFARDLRAQNARFPASLVTGLTLDEGTEPVYAFDLFYLRDGYEVILHWEAADETQLLAQGAHRVEIPLDSAIETGDYFLDRIVLYRWDGVESIYTHYEHGFAQSEEAPGIDHLDADFSISPSLTQPVEGVSASADPAAPLITKAQVRNDALTSPGILYLYMDIYEDGDGVASVECDFRSQNAHLGQTVNRTLVWQPDSLTSVKTGSHTLSFAVPDTFPAGSYELTQIRIEDKNGNVTAYSARGGMLLGGPVPVTATTDFTIVDSEPVDYISTTANQNLAADIERLPENAAIVLDFSDNPVVSASLFEAIAGTNRTLILQDDIVRWQFNGADIAPADCKRLTLSMQYSIVPGSTVGFHQEQTVGLLQFKPNGALPGPVTITVQSPSLAALGKSSDSLYLSYLQDGVPVQESDSVQIGKDGGVSFTMTHNSAFILSETPPPAGVSANVTTDPQENLQQIQNLSMGEFSNTAALTPVSQQGAMEKQLALAISVIVGGILLCLFFVNQTRWRQRRKLRRERKKQAANVIVYEPRQQQRYRPI